MRRGPSGELVWRGLLWGNCGEIWIWPGNVGGDIPRLYTPVTLDVGVKMGGGLVVAMGGCRVWGEWMGFEKISKKYM